MSIPYIGFSNNTLNDCHVVKEGDEIHCEHCNQRHLLECGTVDGQKSNLLMFYKCGDKIYLAAVKGRLIAHTKSDVSGQV